VHVRLLAANQTPVNVVVAHIDRSDERERRRQLRCAGEFFLSLATPAVLLGDLNTTADDEELRRILKAPDVVDALGEKLPEKKSYIDWILTRGLDIVEAGLTEPGPSDHPHVWALVDVPAVEQ
jgi:endonuclease/exonuclease/phosphatase family metal-dependent hydrolase